MSDVVVPIGRARELHPLKVSFACNDPDNGNFTGEFEMIEFDSDDIELELYGFESAVAVEFRPGSVKVGGVDYPTLGVVQHWAGNWCWDAVDMDVANARLLARALLSLGWKPEQWATDGPLSALVEAAHG